ncbi:MAG TPA: aminotransferase class V-fold PLP-dependent enzyme [Gammaproteobacteria bacterium]
MQRHPEFAQAAGLIYLNHAAVAPWPQRTRAAVERFAVENHLHGARHYRDWMEVEERLRERLRRLVNAADSGEIALLKNTSEGLSVVAHGLGWRPGESVVSAREEFPSNRVPWQSLQRLGVETRLATLDGAADPEQALFDLVDDSTRLLAVSAVQYGRGLRMDLARIGRFCRERGLLFCVDAIQQLGALPFDARAIGADFVVADGHKWLLAPEGLALFYCRGELLERLQLHQYGWNMLAARGDYERLDWQPAGDARRFECGSPNMLGIHALDASLSLLEEVGMTTVGERVSANADRLAGALRARDDCTLLSPQEPRRRAGIVCFRPRHAAPEPLHRRLQEAGVICALRGGGIRLSPHFYHGSDDIAAAIEVIGGVLDAAR